MMSNSITDEQQVIAQVRLWLNEVVIGLNLCPFASKPIQENRVRFSVSQARDDEAVLQDLEAEMQLLDSNSATETTLLILPYHLSDFLDYKQFLPWANQLVKRNQWKGVYQIASFHPHYCFSGAEPEDLENLTNRAPFPILHIIREASLAKAIEFFTDVEGIPNKNKLTLEGLSEEEKFRLFPYLISPH